MIRLEIDIDGYNSDIFITFKNFLGPTFKSLIFLTKERKFDENSLESFFIKFNESDIDYIKENKILEILEEKILNDFSFYIDTFNEDFEKFPINSLELTTHKSLNGDFIVKLENSKLILYFTSDDFKNTNKNLSIKSRINIYFTSGIFDVHFNFYQTFEAKERILSNISKHNKLRFIKLLEEKR